MSRKKAAAVPKAAPEIKKKNEVVKAPLKNAQPLIYLGPSISGIARHANVFNNGVLSPALEKAVSETPMMCRLIVPVSESAALIKELKKQSAAANIYKAVAEKYLNK